MPNDKKKPNYLICALLVTGISALAFFLIVQENNLTEILEDIRSADTCWILYGVLLLCFFVAAESAQLKMLFDGMGCQTSFGKCLLLSNVGFFFCQITPGASGGQPMQVVYMTMLGINALVGTLAVMIITVVYKLVLILLFLFFLISRTVLVTSAISDVTVLFIIGLLVQSGFMIFLMVCVFRPSLASRILDGLVQLGLKFHLIKDPEKWQNRIRYSLEQYTQASDFLKSNSFILLKMIAATILQRLAFFSITYCIARSLHVPGCSWFNIVAIQTVLSLAVDVYPIPGSAGLNEYVFLNLQDKLFGPELVSAGVLLNRGITYFLLIILTGILTVITTFYFRDIREKRRRNLKLHREKH